jgi:hypothetical protein
LLHEIISASTPLLRVFSTLLVRVDGMQKPQVMQLSSKISDVVMNFFTV